MHKLIPAHKDALFSNESLGACANLDEVSMNCILDPTIKAIGNTVTLIGLFLDISEIGGKIQERNLLKLLTKVV